MSKKTDELGRLLDIAIWKIAVEEAAKMGKASLARDQKHDARLEALEERPEVGLDVIEARLDYLESMLGSTKMPLMASNGQETDTRRVSSDAIHTDAHDSQECESLVDGVARALVLDNDNSFAYEEEARAAILRVADALETVNEIWSDEVVQRDAANWLRKECGK